MKKIINLLLGVIVCACIAGCKDNSIPADGQLGQLPGIVKKYGDELDALKAKLENSSDTKEMQAIVEKGMAIKKKAEGEVKALADELVGKEIPGEVAQDVPVKILSPFKIKDIRKDGTVQLECEVELTADCGYTPDGSVFNLSNIRVMAVGKDETDAYVHNGGGFRAEKYADVYPKGSKGTVSTFLAVEGWNVEMMGRLSRLVIVDKTGDTFKSVKEANRTAKNDYESISK